MGIDSKTGATKFRVKMPNSTDFTEITEADAAFCQAPGGLITQHAWVDYPWAAIIAGDGFYYVPYRRYASTGEKHRSAAQLFPDAAYDWWDQLGAHVINSNFAAALAAHAALRAATGESYTPWDSALDGHLKDGASGRTAAINLLNLHDQKYRRLCDGSYTWTERLQAMRVASDGTYTDMTVKTWETSVTSTYNLVPSGPLAPWGYRESQTYAGTHDAIVSDVSLITDSDQGVLMSWVVDERCGGGGPLVLVLTNACTPATDEHLTLVTNGALASDVVWGHDWSRRMRLALQLEDGTFVANREVWPNYADTTVAFDATGNVKWELPSTSPLKVVEDGLLVSAFNGRYARIQNAGDISDGVDHRAEYESWRGPGYQGSNGVVEQMASLNLTWGTSFAADLGGSPSPFGTYIGFAPGLEGARVAALQNRGGFCKLGPEIPPLLEDSAFAAFVHYSNMRNAAKDWPGIHPDAPNVAGSCRAFIPFIYFFNLRDAVQRQVPYDGPKTVRSMASLGLFTRSTAPRMFAESIEGRAPVCQVFLDRPGIAAYAQGTSVFGTPDPPTNVFINSNSSVYQRFLTPATIVHEALHNSTGLGDELLPRSLVGVSAEDLAKIDQQSGELDRVLREHSCAPYLVP